MFYVESQGQTLNRVGLYLDRPVFSHGQLYVTFISYIPYLFVIMGWGRFPPHSPLHPMVSFSIYFSNHLYFDVEVALSRVCDPRNLKVFIPYDENRRHGYIDDGDFWVTQNCVVHSVLQEELQQLEELGKTNPFYDVKNMRNKCNFFTKTGNDIPDTIWNESGRWNGRW